MAEFLISQAVWVMAALAFLVLISVTALVAVLFRNRPSNKSAAKSERNYNQYAQKTELEMQISEQANRMRMIGDVHQAAAVTLTNMISQAEGARFSATSDPQVASRAAEAIADSARQVLSDLRRVVNVSKDGVEQVEGLPSLMSIDRLFEAMRESGIAVNFEETGTPFSVSTSAELAIFRILQESLNNTRSHGGPGTTVNVVLSWSGQGLHVRVDDDGTRAKFRFSAPQEPRYTVEDDQAALVEILSGRGMRDMRTRTETFGGVFSAHRVPGVGFSVSAAFPTLRFHNAIHGVGLEDQKSGE